MNQFSKKTTLIRSGIFVMAIAIAGLNVSQSNNKISFASVAKISNAKASAKKLSSGDCNKTAPNQSCSYATPDGIYHTLTNVED